MARRSVKTLIRLAEWKVDERRRRLGDLLLLVENLQKQIEILKQELAREQYVASASPEVAGFLFGNYVKTVIARRAWIEGSIAKAEEEVEAARDELREAYLELKKLDVAEKALVKKAEAELARIDRIALDEVGLQSFRQRSEG